MTASPLSPPRATYRLQLHRGFTFADAAALVDHLAALGVSHLYASPFLKARPGSTHGYDIIDHESLNPEIGSEEDLAALCDKLAAHGMGLVLDHVPNHMGVGGKDNAWWLDVLEWGETSPYADYFDIDWESRRADLRGKVLLPVLGDQYGLVLERGEIVLRFEAEDGSYSAWYYDHRFPISPRRYDAMLRRVHLPGQAGADLAALADGFAKLQAGRSRRQRRLAHADGRRLKAALAELARRVPEAGAALEQAAAALMGEAGKPSSWRRLHALFEAQAWRAAYWRTAADEINYRRFFNINDLAGIRMELPELFARAHHLILTLIAQGRIHGLRIDHIDGLFDPRGYCERLQREAAKAAQCPEGEFYIVVEKILAPHEALRDWPVAGTTGYDFIAQVGGLFVDPAGEEPLTRIYQRFTGRTAEFAPVLYDGKKRVTAVNLASEMNVLARAFHALAMSHWRTRDFTLNLVRAALDEVVALFPVYRTYVTADGASAEDRRYIDWAVGHARKRWPGADTSIFDFVHGVLTGDLAARNSGYSRGVTLRLAMKFQQLTGPVMAKGAEDTAFYRFDRLISLNEVGGDPSRFGLAPAAFHRLCDARAKRWPNALLAATTHDTKRSEDARARLHLLSEMPEAWQDRLDRWEKINALKRAELDGERAPDANDEYFFYETVVGAWPPDLALDEVDRVRDFAERVRGTMIKMAREAKERSSWSNPNADYEGVLGRFVMSALDASRPNPFLQDVCAFVEILARPGAINSLAQTLIRLTAPGAPDIYQGAELFDFAMVDPDNRRPVDWRQRTQILDELRRRARDGKMDRQGFAELAAHWRDGREKMFLTWRTLALRAEHPALFARGDYVPLESGGRHGDRLCAFARVANGLAAVTVAPRLVGAMCRDGAGIAWDDTSIALPEGRVWRDALSGRVLGATSAAPAAALLADFPVALLVGQA